MKVISNASPLIALSQIERLNLLKEIWGEIIIPKAVYNEVVLKGKRKPGVKLIEKAINEGWIKIFKIKNEQQVKTLMSILDYGEAEVIVLAQEIQAQLVILDNREPRLFAFQIGIKVIGTIGVILKAYEKNLILNPLDEIYRLRNYGFYISNNLLNYIKTILENR